MPSRRFFWDWMPVGLADAVNFYVSSDRFCAENTGSWLQALFSRWALSPEDGDR